MELVGHITSVLLTDSVFVSSVVRSKKVIKLVPEYLLKKRKAYQAIKAIQAKLAMRVQILQNVSLNMLFLIWSQCDDDDDDDDVVRGMECISL